MSLHLFKTLESRRSDHYHAKCEYSTFLREKRSDRPRIRSMSQFDHRWNVVGIGVSEKRVDGLPTGEPAIQFMVRCKSHFRTLPSRSRLRLPRKIDGLPTDVVEVGRVRLAAGTQISNPDTSAVDPLVPGCSVGFRNDDGTVNVGTLGAVVKDANGRRLLLSNAHVFGNPNDPAKLLPITQPGTQDAATPRVIGQRVAQVFPDPAIKNLIDAALVEPNTAISPLIKEIGPVRGAGVATQNMMVEKYGRTTRFRVGIVDGLFQDVYLTPPGGEELHFVNQIAIKKVDDNLFADGGDSGALVLDRATSQAVGLFFSISVDGIAFAHHISDVLRIMKVTLE